MKALVVLLLVGVCSCYQHNLNDYLKEFETLAKDNVFLEHVSQFDIPSAMKLYFRIELSGWPQFFYLIF